MRTWNAIVYVVGAFIAIQVGISVRSRDAQRTDVLNVMEILAKGGRVDNFDCKCTRQGIRYEDLYNITNIQLKPSLCSARFVSSFLRACGKSCHPHALRRLDEFNRTCSRLLAFLGRALAKPRTFIHQPEMLDRSKYYLYTKFAKEEVERELASVLGSVLPVSGPSPNYPSDSDRLTELTAWDGNHPRPDRWDDYFSHLSLFDGIDVVSAINDEVDQIVTLPTNPIWSVEELFDWSSDSPSYEYYVTFLCKPVQCTVRGYIAQSGYLDFGDILITMGALAPLFGVFFPILFGRLKKMPIADKMRCLFKEGSCATFVRHVAYCILPKEGATAVDAFALKVEDRESAAVAPEIRQHEPIVAPASTQSSSCFQQRIDAYAARVNLRDIPLLEISEYPNYFVRGVIMLVLAFATSGAVVGVLVTDLQSQQIVLTNEAPKMSDFTSVPDIACPCRSPSEIYYTEVFGLQASHHRWCNDSNIFSNVERVEAYCVRNPSKCPNVPNLITGFKDRYDDRNDKLTKHADWLDDQCRALMRITQNVMSHLHGIGKSFYITEMLTEEALHEILQSVLHDTLATIDRKTATFRAAALLSDIETFRTKDPWMTKSALFGHIPPYDTWPDDPSFASSVNVTFTKIDMEHVWEKCKPSTCTYPGPIPNWNIARSALAVGGKIITWVLALLGLVFRAVPKMSWEPAMSETVLASAPGGIIANLCCPPLIEHKTAHFGRGAIRSCLVLTGTMVLASTVAFTTIFVPVHSTIVQHVSMTLSEYSRQRNAPTPGVYVQCPVIPVPVTAPSTIRGALPACEMSHVNEFRKSLKSDYELMTNDLCPKNNTSSSSTRPPELYCSSAVLRYAAATRADRICTSQTIFLKSLEQHTFDAWRIAEDPNFSGWSHQFRQMEKALERSYMDVIDSVAMQPVSQQYRYLLNPYIGEDSPFDAAPSYPTQYVQEKLFVNLSSYVSSGTFTIFDAAHLFERDFRAVYKTTSSYKEFQSGNITSPIRVQIHDFPADAKVLNCTREINVPPSAANRMGRAIATISGAEVFVVLVFSYPFTMLMFIPFSDRIGNSISSSALAWTPLWIISAYAYLILAMAATIVAWGQ